MRYRAIVLVVGILLIAAFAALNWGEIIRPSTVWFGPFVADAPLGAILLGLLALSVVIFALSAGTIRTQALMDFRAHQKALEAQRELADKAEASRFTDLRQHLDAQLRDLREHDALRTTEFEKSMVQSQREMRAQLEQINRTIAARLTEVEHRIDTRLGAAPAQGTLPVVHERVQPVTSGIVRPDPAVAREAQLREERARAEQHASDVRAQQERPREDMRSDTTAADRPAAASGWRRWF